MTLSRRSFLTFAVAAPVATLALPQAAIAAQVYENRGIAVDGTDVVAYFTDSAPVSGNRDITHNWNGVTWRFASVENCDAFAADPEAYAPQYGGFCAWAVAQGSTASTTPEAWKIVDGKLYLNYSNRIQRRWERDIPGNIAAADANWPDLI